MPLYSFHNTDTDEIWEDFMSISSMESYLSDNPHVIQIIEAPAIISGISGVTHKNDSGFKDMMSRIASANPTSPLASQYGDKGTKASKTRDAINRQKARQIARSVD
jgi:hypothetical protein